MRTSCDCPKRAAAAVLSLSLVLTLMSRADATPTPQKVCLRQGAEGYAGCADNWMWQYSNGDDNYGADTGIYIRYDANNDLDRATLIRFDLTGQIPAGACIKSATLRLYQHSDHSIGSGEWLVVAAYRLLKDWTEGNGGGDSSGSCWRYRHANATYPWMSLAARGVDSDAAADRHHTHHVAHPYVGVPDSTITCTAGAR